jgi:hypothetical protein
MFAAMREFNEVIGLFDLISTRNHFMNRLKITLYTYPTLHLPQDKLCMVTVACYYTQRARRSINVTGIIHYFIALKLSVRHKSVDKREINK